MIQVKPSTYEEKIDNVGIATENKLLRHGAEYEYSPEEIMDVFMEIYNPEPVERLLSPQEAYSKAMELAMVYNSLLDESMDDNSYRQPVRITQRDIDEIDPSRYQSVIDQLSQKIDALSRGSYSLVEDPIYDDGGVMDMSDEEFIDQYQNQPSVY